MNTFPFGHEVPPVLNAWEHLSRTYATARIGRTLGRIVYIGNPDIELPDIGTMDILCSNGNESELLAAYYDPANLDHIGLSISSHPGEPRTPTSQYYVLGRNGIVAMDEGLTRSDIRHMIEVANRFSTDVNLTLEHTMRMRRSFHQMGRLTLDAELD